MPRRIATQLASDDAVGSEELEAAIFYLNEKSKMQHKETSPSLFSPTETD